MKVEVQALTDADPHVIHREQKVRGSGTMLVKGDALSRKQLQTILQTGFAESTPDGVRVAFDYADGILHVNGRPLNAAMVQGFLAQVDGAINPILARNAVPLTSPESVAEQPVAAGPGAPAAAPSAEALAHALQGIGEPGLHRTVAVRNTRPSSPT